MESRSTLNAYYSLHSKYRYDLILFPRILEICFNYLIQMRNGQLVELNLISSAQMATEFQAKYIKSTSVVQQFFKRILYLLESCNFNVHILINNVSISSFFFNSFEVQIISFSLLELSPIFHRLFACKQQQTVESLERLFGTTGRLLQVGAAVY